MRKRYPVRKGYTDQTLHTLMTEPADSATFLERHREALTLHVPDLLQRVADGSLHVSASRGASVSELLRVYDLRAERLKTSKTSYAFELQRQVENLRRSLRNATEPACTVWQLELSDGARLLAFEGEATRQLFGAMLVYDQRALTPDGRNGDGSFQP